MRNNNNKIKDIVNDSRLLVTHKNMLVAWVEHVSSFRSEQSILSELYTLREFAIVIKKPFQDITEEDLKNYITKKMSGKSITGNRVLNTNQNSLRCYSYRLRTFYRWINKYTNYRIDNEIIYPSPKISSKVQLEREELAERNIQNILTNSQKTKLSVSNLDILKRFHSYKISSSIVESNRGFVSKMYFLRRLGLFLDNKKLTYKDAKRENIEEFLLYIKNNLNNAKNIKKIINATYKSILLDFYRFLYDLHNDNSIPKKYPLVISWLYTKRKKSYDKVKKEIITDEQIRLMIEKTPETRDKALISLFADCSGRVEEIASLKIKDLEILSETNPSIWKVILRGKTGERKNTLFYSIPYLRLWLASHPFKNNPDAPLFIATSTNRFGLRLTGVGINKILQRAVKRAKLDIHVHAHLFRHTNLTRMARILSESELKIHAGWSKDSNMASVYVHLNEEDVSNKILQSYGVKTKTQKEDKPLLERKVCVNPLCAFENPSEAKFCLKCGNPLDKKTALEMREIKVKEQYLHTELNNHSLDGVNLEGVKDPKEIYYRILKSDPKLISKLKEIIELVDK